MKNDFKFLLVYPNKMMAMMLPLSISVLSAVLKQNGVNVQLFDTTYYHLEEKSMDEKLVDVLQVKKFSYEDADVKLIDDNVTEAFEASIRQFHPDLIGVSVVEETFELGMRLIDVVKGKIPVVVGGVYTYFAADDIIAHDGVDFVCVGEGEYAMTELCEALSENKSPDNIQNLWIKKPDGTVIKNRLRPLVDLNKLPFIDLDIYDKRRLYRPMNGVLKKMIHVEVHRGCPYECTFCCAPAIKNYYKKHGIDGYWRRKKPERFIEELVFLKNRYGAEYLSIGAETFLAVPDEEFERFAIKYDREVKLPFWLQTRPETISDKKMRLLKEIGCKDISYGVEHGNELFRKKILKRYGSNEQILEAVGITEKYDIPYTVNNIIGFPEETRELIFDTINLNRNFKNAKNYNCSIFTPYHGTPLRNVCVERGYIDKNAPVIDMLYGADYHYDTISMEELKGIQRCFSLYIRLPRDRYNEIEKAEHFDADGNATFERLAAEYTKKYFL